MKVNTEKLLEALTKVSGIVNDKAVVQDLRSFHLLPENGVLKLAGTDSNTTLIEKVEYEETENSDGTMLILSADKIIDVVRYAGGEEIEFVYTEEDEGLKVVTPKNSVTLFKHFAFMEDVIDFELDNMNDFVDEIEVGKLKTILNSLSSVIDSSATDPSFKTIFLNGEKALVGDESTISTIDCETNEKYEFSLKIAKQIISLLNGLDDDSLVKMKKFADGTRVLLRTDLDVMSFGVSDVFEPDLDVIDEFESTASVLVGKDNLTRGIHLVKATSDEDRIYVEINESTAELTSHNQGEEAKDDVDVVKGIVKDVVKFESLAPELLKLISIINSEGVVLAVDKESSILQVRSPKKEVVSAISILLEN